MDAVIFDVDGTLWDSTDEVAASWNEVLREETDLERRVTSEELKKEFGKPLEEIMEDLFPELTKKDQLELSKALFLRQNKWMETAPCKVYEGVPEVIRQLAQEHMTMIIVTHEMQFARELSDRIIFMEQGVICQEGTPEELFSSPNARVREFIGRVMNV